jgi:hypothetical protein
MSGSPETEAEERAVLTSFCHSLPTLRAEANRLSAEQRTLLVLIEQEATARRPIGRLSRRFADLANADPLRNPFQQLPWSEGEADEEVLECPDGACERRVRIMPAGLLPRCNVTKERMTRKASE